MVRSSVDKDRNEVIDNLSPKLSLHTDGHTRKAQQSLFARGAEHREEKLRAAHTEAMHISVDLIKKLVAEYPQLDGYKNTLFEDAKEFLKNTIVLEYLYNRNGDQSILEGTPKGNGELSSVVEFQKTMGTYLAVSALNHYRVDIFKSPLEEKNTLESRLANLYFDVNSQYAGKFTDQNDPMGSVLTIHDIMKSFDKCDTVRAHLKNHPVTINGVEYSAEKFKFLDHDTKLLVAMHLMDNERIEGRDMLPDALVLEFFPAAKVQRAEHREIVSLMKTMWGLQLNSLQINQGENHPAQLQEFLKQVINADEAEYASIIVALEAYCAHESSDLLGAANPFVAVLGSPVVKPVPDMFVKLSALANELREKNKTAPVDLRQEAKVFYDQLLPTLSAQNLSDVTSKLGAAEVQAGKVDGGAEALLVRRLGRMSRLQEAGLGQAISVLGQLKGEDPAAYQALLDMYGSLDNKIFLYYGPALLEMFYDKDKKGFSDVQLKDAFQTLGMAAKFVEGAIKNEGGEEAFVKKYGVDFLNTRNLCLGVAKEIKRAEAAGEPFNAANLLLAVEDNNLSLQTTHSE